jgi:endonuclease/exonuclease/phosphatase family metal-dependent hydrolase
VLVYNGGMRQWLTLGLAGALMMPCTYAATSVLTADQLQGFNQPTIAPALTAQAEDVLHTVWRYPLSGTKPVRTISQPALGPFVRVASWNMERGAQMERMAMWLNSPGSANLPEARASARLLADADVWLLSEVDMGLGRTQYRNIAKEFGQKLGMHVVFAPEFIELAPFFRESKSDETGRPIDKAKYMGLHGGAILSRYPVVDARVIRLPECYDWFDSERKKLSELEKLRRTASQALFKEDVYTEVRYGSRMALLATLAVPQLNGVGKMTVVSLHLENRCMPLCRQRQMQSLLSQIGHIRHPVVMAGDWNTSGTDVSPTSVKKELRVRLKDPSFWTKQALSWLTPFGLPLNIGLNSFQYVKNLYNPTASSIPLLAVNREEGLFDMLRAYRFADGTMFDFRGDDARSIDGRGGLLANSNQRWLKGFVPTFTFERPLIKGAIGKYKLDWMMVRGFNGMSEDSTVYRFAPHFGRTHRDINTAAKKLWGDRMSDHDPMSLDLPFNEPSAFKSRTK